MERQGLMDRPDLGALFLQFLVLSFLAIGGAPTVLPDIHRYVVEVHHWMTSAQFAELYALAQVAPGPNAMFVTLIGWRVWRGGRVRPRPRSHCSCQPAPSRCWSDTCTRAIPTARSLSPSAAA